jgi:hypothetical protein
MKYNKIEKKIGENSQIALHLGQTARISLRGVPRNTIVEL